MNQFGSGCYKDIAGTVSLASAAADYPLDHLEYLLSQRAEVTDIDVRGVAFITIVAQSLLPSFFYFLAGDFSCSGAVGYAD